VNVAFINPNMSDFKSKDVLPPLWAGILSALTPEIWHKQLFDDRIESIPLNTKFDVVAISVQTFTAQRAYFLDCFVQHLLKSQARYLRHLQ